MTKIIITKVDNGYLLESPGNDYEHGKVFRAIEEGFSSEKIALVRVLEVVASYFGFSYDKDSESNLKITWEKPGSKVEED